VDYADLHIGAYRPFYIFNLADVAITFGVLIILPAAFFRAKSGHIKLDAAPSIPEN
jgi:signal peptidase II